MFVVVRNRQIQRENLAKERFNEKTVLNVEVDGRRRCVIKARASKAAQKKDKHLFG